MKKYFRLFLTVLLCAMIPLGLILAREVMGYRSRDVKPLDGQRNLQVLIDTSGKRHAYHRLTVEDPVVVSLNGPGRLRVITRFEFDGLKDKNKEYAVYVSCDDGPAVRYAFTAEVSSLSFYVQERSGLYPGKSRSMFFDMPQGRHKWRFFLDEKSQYCVNMRFLVDNGKRELGPKAIEIINPLPAQDVIIAGARKSYYRADTLNPLVFKVSGPGKFVIYSRLVFPAADETPRNYEFALYDGGALKSRHIFKGVVFKKAKLAGQQGIERSGYLNKVTIDASAGEHIYTVKPSGSMAVLFRVKVKGKK